MKGIIQRLNPQERKNELAKKRTDWKQLPGIAIADVRSREFLSWVICKDQQGIVDLLGLPCGDWGE